MNTQIANRSKETDNMKTVNEQRVAVKDIMSDFPYTSKLSLEPLIEFWKDREHCDDIGTGIFARHVLEHFKGHEELLEPVNDKTELDKHKEFISLLMSGLFPATVRSEMMAKVARPFSMDGVFETSLVKKITESNKFRVCLEKDPAFLSSVSIISAASMILNKFYGQHIEVENQSLFSIRSEEGTEYHFKAKVNTNFFKVVKTKPLKKLSQDQINELLTNVYDIEKWLDCVPPDRFEFVGLSIVTLSDISEEETLSKLKHSLLQKDAIVTSNNVINLQDLLRTYFRRPELEVGITALDYPSENAIEHEYKIRFNLLAKKFDTLLNPAYNDSIYEQACKSGELLIVEDLRKVKAPTPLESALLKKGLHSVVLIPLKSKKNAIIGMLELASPKPYDLNSFTMLKLREVIPLFRTAIQRSREEVDNTIEVIIREQYTAIHPSVEWRFIEAAYRLMERREKGEENTKVESIVFNDVYPLYGQSDIVSSSRIRNEAIQTDLIANLRFALEALKTIEKNLKLPIVLQYVQKVNAELEKLNNDFSTNDEYRLIVFLKEEVGQVFELVTGRNGECDEAVAEYKAKLSPQLGIVYEHRKNYEDSVSKINDTLGNYLEQQQLQVQEVLPHYFEKYKTDGVEYDIYIGQSLLKSERFHQMHLRNLRLWQLISMCEIARKVEALRPRLLVPLTTAQLILVHNNPLSIRFRMDEKQFDVDGAYNVRYEIVKKRIDKSRIKGTGERLTLSGKVAIVYSDEDNQAEYRQYFEYLVAEKFISPDIEDVYLEDLQALQGLRAFRISVLMTNGEPIG